MSECQFCGLPTDDLFYIYDMAVCLDCTDLAEMTYSEDEVEA